MSTDTWSNLPKAQDDDETIEEAIDRLIQAHDDDSDAHLDEGQALKSHKASEVIDHLATSIVTDKIKDEDITNIKVDPKARAFKAIVDAAGNADYTDIQDAIDYVHSEGGGKIFILPGTYTLSSDIDLYSNIDLIGLEAETVIIDCDSTANRVKVTGTDSTDRVENVTLNNITLKNWSDDSLDDRGALTLKNCSKVEITYCIFDNNEQVSTLGDMAIGSNADDIFIDKNRFLRNSSGAIRFFANLNNVSITDNYIETGLYASSDNLDIAIINNYFTYGVNVSPIHIEDAGGDIRITNNEFNGVYERDSGMADPNIWLWGLLRGTIIANNLFYNCSAGNIGIIDTGGEVDFETIGATISNNVIKDCEGSGISLSYVTLNTVVDGNVIINPTKYGIAIQNSYCQDNILSSNQIRGAGNAAIKNNGTNTIIANNQGEDYIESFEANNLGHWENDPNHDQDWSTKTGETASPSTGPSSARDGVYYIYVETSDGHAFDNGDESIIDYDMGESKDGFLEFYYHQYGSDQGTLSLQGYDGSWNTIWSSTGNQGDQWNHVTSPDTDFSDYSKLRFKNVAAGGYYGDVALDLIKVIIT